MGKRILSVALTLAMMLSLVPCMSVAASAEEDLSEVIAFNESDTASSEHFSLEAYRSDSDGWRVDNGGAPLTVTARTDNIVITAVEMEIGSHGENYAAVSFSSGIKNEDGIMSEGALVHVTNINAAQLTVSCSSFIQFKDIKVSYTFEHIHDFTASYWDNGNRTHTGICACGEPNPEMTPHNFDDAGLCVCGLHEYENPQVEVMHFDTDNVYGIRYGTESAHFTLKSDAADIDGWYAGYGDVIDIHAKDENTIITAIDAIVGHHGEYFYKVKFSSGKTIASTVERYTSTTIININSNRLKMEYFDPEYVQFRDITFYYTVPHEHDYTYRYIDNLDGTHTGMCVCRELAAEAEKHSYNEDGICLCGAADYYDKFVYSSNDPNPESEHFYLYNDAPQSGDGWTAGSGHTIHIEDKNPHYNTYFITGADLTVTKNGANYSNVKYKGRANAEVGTKTEKDAVEDGSVVHLTGLEASYIDISCEDGEVEFDDITVYYTHYHVFEGQFKDNGDGTHSRKCAGCDEYGEPARHFHIISGKCPCGAAIPGEVFSFNNEAAAETAHFTLSNDTDGYHGWRVGNGHTITIDSKCPTETIASIDAVVNAFGSNYANVKYSSGEKNEWSWVYDGSTVHIKNINSTHLEISCPEGSGEFGSITVYYLHDHDFSGAGKDNGNGTHSLKCIGCDECGPESFAHSYRPVEQVSDAPLTYTARCTSCGNEIDDFQIKDRSYTHTSTTTYSSVAVGETMPGGISIQAKYWAGNAKMIVYIDEEKGIVVEEGKYWTTPQCVKCLRFESHWPSSDPLEIWFESICDYTYATCEQPETCVYCRSTRGEALGHNWAEATCTEPKTCLHCGITEGLALGHLLTAPDCTTPEFCLRCHEQFGPPAHDWTYATCTKPKTCAVCGATEGDALGHAWNGGEITTPATDLTDGVMTYTCTKCGETKEEAFQKPVPYVYYTMDGTRHDDGLCTEYVVVTGDTTELEDGKWYVVGGNVTVPERITVSGAANLILCDGAKLTAQKSIAIGADASLALCGQSGETGSLYAAYIALGGTALTVHGGAVSADKTVVSGSSEIALYGGAALTVETGLTVINGGKVTNGTLRIRDDAVVSLRANSGWVPVPVASADGYTTYDLHYAGIKLGKDITDLGTGAKFALGYKYAEYAAYGETAAAAENFAGVLKLGAHVSLVNGENELSGDFVISKESIAKMSEVDADDEEAFYRANISLKGSGVKSISAQPLIAVKALGFRLLGTEGSWEKK